MYNRDRKSRRGKRIIVFILLFIQCICYSQSFVPGASYFGRNNYIEYIAGNLPLIIAVPHGGDLTPAEIPDRSCGDETVTDSYTVSLAELIQKEITNITGCYPHIIISHLKRTKLDANREIEGAACGNEYAEIAWNEFHNFIDSAKKEVVKQSGKGLFIDLHGHGHTVQRLELGYLLSAIQLASSDAILNTPALINISSIRNLIGSNITNMQHSDLLRGIYSLGSMFAVKGYPSVPGIDDPFPLTGQPYFSGGYSTQRHGSVTGGTIDAIQIECNQDVRFDETERREFAAASAEVFLTYMIKHYFPQLPSTYCNLVDIDIPTSGDFTIYPVPFSDLLTLRGPVPVTINIYNYRGECIYSGQITTEEKLDLHQLESGFYLVTLSSNGEILFRQGIIKQ